MKAMGLRLLSSALGQPGLRTEPGPSEAKLCRAGAVPSSLLHPHGTCWGTEPGAQGGVPGAGGSAAVCAGGKLCSGGGSTKLQSLNLKPLGLHTRVAEPVTVKSERDGEGEERARAQIGSDSGALSELLW